MHTDTRACILPLPFTPLNIKITLRCRLVAPPSIQCCFFLQNASQSRLALRQSHSCLLLLYDTYIYLIFINQRARWPVPQRASRCLSLSLTLSPSHPCLAAARSNQSDPYRLTRIDILKWFQQKQVFPSLKTPVDVTHCDSASSWSCRVQKEVFFCGCCCFCTHMELDTHTFYNPEKSQPLHGPLCLRVCRWLIWI